MSKKTNIQPKVIVPLSYAGGKSKVIKKLLFPLFLANFNDFYEPFIGGGSAALFVAQQYPDKQIYINDINSSLIDFWVSIQNNIDTLIKDLHEIRNKYNKNSLDDGKLLLEEMNRIIESETNTLEKAKAFYVLNKISFSGLTEHGSLSKYNYANKFNDGNINKLYEIHENMKNFHIYNEDFTIFLNKAKENDFMFLDPPYKIASSTLYGKDGKNHINFNHFQFYNCVENLKCKWLLTYNDSEEIRDLYKNYNIVDAEYKYSLTFNTDENGNKISRLKNELIIMNY